MTWLVLGVAVALQLVAGAVRVRGWFHVIRSSCPDGRSLRYRDVVLAQLGGCGWNAVLPARAGDAVKVALVRRRMPTTPLAALVGTLVAPALVDAALTALLIAVLFGAGTLGPGDLTPNLPGTSAIAIAGALGCAGLLVLCVQRHRLVRIARDARAALAVVGRPRFIAARVVPWQLAARGLRLLSLACVLVAAGLPFGLAPALLLMALQGASASVSPMATAVRVALLAGLLAGTAQVDPAHVAAVLVAAYGAVSATNLAVSGAVIALELRTVSPQRILRYARTAVAAAGRTSPAPSA
jgi:Lysylphosphatidylglycerol synthase TM region